MPRFGLGPSAADGGEVGAGSPAAAVAGRPGVHVVLGVKLGIPGQHLANEVLQVGRFGGSPVSTATTATLFWVEQPTSAAPQRRLQRNVLRQQPQARSCAHLIVSWTDLERLPCERWSAKNS